MTVRSLVTTLRQGDGCKDFENFNVFCNLGSVLEIPCDSKLKNVDLHIKTCQLANTKNKASAEK